MENEMVTIQVVDSLMGSGKTTHAVNDMNANPSERYVYVVKYLEEANRIQESCPELHFKQPMVDKTGGKQGDFHALIKRRENIITTHALFSLLHLSETELKQIGEAGYG